MAAHGSGLEWTPTGDPSTWATDVLARMDPAVMDDKMKDALRARATTSLHKTARWKMCSPGKMDATPLVSSSNAAYRHQEVAEGTIPKEHRIQKGLFGDYLKKAMELHVNLKSTAH